MTQLVERVDIHACILGSHEMKGTAHALTCIDSLPTAIRREIYIIPCHRNCSKTNILCHTTVNSQNLHVELVHQTPCQLFQRIAH